MIRNINGKYSRLLSDNNLVGPITPTGGTILNAVFLNPNELPSPNVCHLRTLIEKSGTTNAFIFRFYWNTTKTIGGATLLGSYAMPAAAIGTISLSRRIFFNTSTTARMLNPSYSAQTNDIQDLPTTISTITVSNWLANGGYFFVYCDASPGAVDTITGIYLSIEV